MKKAMFEELLESVREAGRIRRGEAKPSRVFYFTPTDVKAIRARLGKPSLPTSMRHGPR
jgi:putative transcriptional regulator